MKSICTCVLLYVNIFSDNRGFDDDPFDQLRDETELGEF